MTSAMRYITPRCGCVGLVLFVLVLRQERKSSTETHKHKQTGRYTASVQQPRGSLEGVPPALVVATSSCSGSENMIKDRTVHSQYDSIDIVQEEENGYEDGVFRFIEPRKLTFKEQRRRILVCTIPIIIGLVLGGCFVVGGYCLARPPSDIVTTKSICGAILYPRASKVRVVVTTAAVPNQGPQLPKPVTMTAAPTPAPTTKRPATSAACASNSACAAMQLQGACCPTIEGVVLQCCHG